LVPLRRESFLSKEHAHDEFCLTLLARSEHQEALTWLRAGAGKHTIGELPDTESSLALVEALYSAGALHVEAVEIASYPRMGNRQNTGKLVVTLPSESAARLRVFAWSAPIAASLGFDPEPDNGQEYLFVALD
jgi:hypothetical protein